MTGIEKKKLTEKGLSCLSVLNRLFSDALQKGEFEEAKTWYHKYAGSVDVLVALGLFTEEKGAILTERAYHRYSIAKYPGAYEEDT